jgi:hypothetical protein
MAGERRNQTGGLTIVAIDPGDVHTGIAVIEVHGKISLWSTMVAYSDEDYLRPVSIVENVLKRPTPTYLAMENFNFRAVGHQSGSKGLTPRLIGALEYLAKIYKIPPAFFFPPGNIEKDLKGLHLYEILDMWNWPYHRYAEHGRSAWRIMGMTILNHFPELHCLLDADVKVVPCVREKDHLFTGEHRWDFITPQIKVRVP